MSYEQEHLILLIKPLNSLGSKGCHVSVVILCVLLALIFGGGVVEELKKRALLRYSSLKGSDSERLVSGSDDFTLFLWDPGESKKPKARMTGRTF